MRVVGPLQGLGARAGLLAGAFVALLLGVTKAADDHDFNIPAGPATSALEAFGEQSGKQVLFPSDAVGGRRTPAIVGHLPDMAVLQRLAEAAGLEISSDDGSAVALTAISHFEQPIINQDLLVTARRRSESLYQTPMAVSVLTGDQMLEAGVIDANQLQYLAPSLTVSQGQQGVELTIRGVTTNDTSTKGEPDIAFNIDGVPTLRSEEQSLSFFDLQRIEVLNGPQSTLYGVASTGGDVNLVTNAPTWTKVATGIVEVGNYDTRRVQAMINEPFNEHISFRAAISGNMRDGYVRLTGAADPDVPDGEKNFSFRASLLARFSDEIVARLTEASGFVSGTGQADVLPLSLNGVPTRDSEYVAHANIVGYSNQFRGITSDEWDSPTLQIDSSISTIHLTLLSNYHYFHENMLAPSYTPDNDGARFWLREHFQTFFEELRVSNHEVDSRLQYIFGINYLCQRNDENGHSWQLDSDAPRPLDPDYENTNDAINTTSQTSLSVFTHTITQLTNRIRITAGVRASVDTDDRVGTFAFGPGLPFGGPYTFLWPNRYGTPCIGSQDCIGENDTASQHTKAFSWNLGVDYRFSGAQMIYVNNARGYKPGGFNDPNASLPGGGTAPYKAERLNDYELGYKLSTPLGWRMSADLFYYDYGAEQVNEGVQLNSSTTLYYMALKPTTEYGLESSLTIPLTPSDQATITANFLHGEYSTGNGSITGWSLSNMPSAVLGLSYAHSWKLPNGGIVRIHAQSRWSSKYVENDLPNSDRFIQPSFTRSDAELSYTSHDVKFTTQIFIKNIENKIQFTAAGFNPSTNSVNGQITSPRFWGIREIVRF